MRNCVKCGKDPHDRFLRCSECNPHDTHVTCKCRGCQCHGYFTPDGDFIPIGYEYNIVGDLVPQGGDFVPFEEDPGE